MSGGALGLQNVGLSCFAGVALQLLSHAEPFLLWVMSLSKTVLQRCPILGALRTLEDGLLKEARFSGGPCPCGRVPMNSGCPCARESSVCPYVRESSVCPCARGAVMELMFLKALTLSGHM